MVRGEAKKSFSIRSKKKVKSDADRTSTGSTDQRPTVKVYLPNGDFRSVKCGDTTDIKVSISPSTPPLSYTKTRTKFGLNSGSYIEFVWTFSTASQNFL